MMYKIIHSEIQVILTQQAIHTVGPQPTIFTATFKN